MANQKENPKPRNVPKVSSRVGGSSKTFRSQKSMASTQSAPAATSEDIATKSEMLFMAIQLESIRKSNEELQHQQEKKYSITMDAAESLRQELQRAKANNASLLAEIEVGKEKFDRLQTELEQLRKRFVSCQKELKLLSMEKRFWDDTKELLEKTEARCSKLSKINRTLRATLIQHHINPDENAKSVRFPRGGKMSPSVRSKKPINAVSIRNKLSPNKVLWN